MDPAFEYLQKEVDSSLIPGLMEFLKVPNQSRKFDPKWNSNGLLQKACETAIAWFKIQNIQGATLHYFNEAEKPPVVAIEVTGPKPDTVLIYGHLDKQPPLTEAWTKGKPYEPAIIDGKLYGRGSADDGHAFYLAVTIIKALQKFQKQKSRFVLVFEADEESGSSYLPDFLEQQKELLGNVKLIINLDSGSTSHNHFGYNTTLRGNVVVNLTIKVLQNAVHSGLASGIVPDSFRIARKMIEEIEFCESGVSRIEGLTKPIPASVYQDVEHLVQELGPNFDFKWPFLDGVQPVTKDLFQQMINSTWLPTFTLTGVEGVPSIQEAGNVVRPSTTLLFSVRTPPHISAKEAKEAIIKHFESMVKPYNAVVELKVLAGNGFVAPPLPPKMEQQLNESAKKSFGKGIIKFGSGGTIPILGKISSLYPNTPFLNTGCCLYDSNMHGPNENVDIAYMKKHICAFYDFMANFEP